MCRTTSIVNAPPINVTSPTIRVCSRVESAGSRGFSALELGSLGPKSTTGATQWHSPICLKARAASGRRVAGNDLSGAALKLAGELDVRKPQ